MAIAQNGLGLGGAGGLTRYSIAVGPELPAPCGSGPWAAGCGAAANLIVQPHPKLEQPEMVAQVPDQSSGVNLGTVPVYYGLRRLPIARLSCVGFCVFVTSAKEPTSMAKFESLLVSRRGLPCAHFGRYFQYI